MLLNFIIVFISFAASMLGAITGIGGGVIIKPVIDATGLLEVAVISFLSGCSVLSMSIVSSFRNRNLDVKTDRTKTVLIAVGSIIGGISGKSIFDALKSIYDSNLIGRCQSAALFVLTLFVLIYTVNKARIRKLNIKNYPLTVLIGLTLGLTSSFLGIGGGPINIMFLSLFFSMDSKAATVNSLCIIMLSQISNIVFSLFNRTIPAFEVDNLIFIISGAVCGGLVGSAVLKRISIKSIDKVFDFILVTVCLICAYNFRRFM